MKTKPLRTSSAEESLLAEKCICPDLPATEYIGGHGSNEDSDRYCYRFI